MRRRQNSKFHADSGTNPTIRTSLKNKTIVFGSLCFHNLYKRHRIKCFSSRYSNNDLFPLRCRYSSCLSRFSGSWLPRKHRLFSRRHGTFLLFEMTSSLNFAVISSCVSSLSILLLTFLVFHTHRSCLSGTGLPRELRLSSRRHGTCHLFENDNEFEMK